MNELAAEIAPPATPATCSLDAGATISLDAIDQGWVVQSGQVELYATLQRDGQIVSGRRFLCAMPEGRLIPPLLAELPGINILVLATESATLLPLGLHVLSSVAADATKRPALAAQLDRWLCGLGAALAMILGPIPTEAIALPADETFPAAADAIITARAGAVWLGAASGRLAFADGRTVSNIAGTERCVGLVTPGTWLTVPAADTIVSLSTT